MSQMGTAVHKCALACRHCLASPDYIMQNKNNCSTCDSDIGQVGLQFVYMIIYNKNIMPMSSFFVYTLL